MIFLCKREVICHSEKWAVKSFNVDFIQKSLKLWKFTVLKNSKIDKFEFFSRPNWNLKWLCVC